MPQSANTCKGLRILLAGTYPPPFGGIASHLTTLIPGLKGRGAEDIAVVSFGAESRAEKGDVFKLYRYNVKREGWRLVNPANWGVIIQALRSLWPHGLGIRALLIECIKAVLVDRIAEAHRSNVVSFYQCDLNIQMLPLARVWGKRRAIVLTVFGEFYERLGFMNKHRDLIKELIDVPHAVASSSRHCAQAYRTIGVTRPIEAVYYGVDLDAEVSASLRTRFRDMHQIGSDEVVILFMGRFTKEMGLDVLLKAAPVLIGKNGAVRLVIAGARGDQSGQASKLAAAHPRRVLVMQDVSISQQRAIYSAADVLVAPSFNQRACMGMAIKEAMAAGLPVIGGAGGGVPEAVVDGKTGYLISLDSSGAVDLGQFVSCVLRLAEEPDSRRRLGRAGRQRAEELFSYEKTNQRMAEIFVSAAAR